MGDPKRVKNMSRIILMVLMKKNDVTIIFLSFIEIIHHNKSVN